MSALDGLAADDLHRLPSAELLDRVAELVRARNRIDAELARTVRRAELAQAPEHDGLKTMHSWLRGHARLSPAAAGQLVRNGRALEFLPAVAAGSAAGRDHRRAGRRTRPGDPPGAPGRRRRPGRRAARGRPRAGRAGRHPPARAAGPGGGPLSGPAGSRRTRTRPHRRPVADAGPPQRRHRRAARPAGRGRRREAGRRAGIAGPVRPAGDRRTRAQQLGDALVQLADNALASGDLPRLRTVKPQLLVMIPAADLLAPATGPAAAETGFGAILSAARARWAACDATLTRIVLGPDGLPLNHGRTRRLVSPQLRRAVELRDRQCVFAGCHAPTHWCDVHHVLEWINGGQTCLENSALLCERHHTKVHHGFHIQRDPDGRWHTYRPDGTEIPLPRPLLLADCRASGLPSARAAERPAAAP